MEGLQICVRMTDGISFFLSSHCHSNKGLIEGAEAPTRKRRWVSETGGGSWSESTWGKDQKEAHREGRLSKLKRGHRSGCKHGSQAVLSSAAAHLIMFHMLNPSSGFVPLVVPPATATRVGSQSETCMSSRLTVPGRSSSGLATNPTPLTPPSHSVFFLPRSGQLLPPYIV